MHYESQQEHDHYEGAMEQSVPQEEPPKESGWRERFDEKFNYVGNALDVYTANTYLEIKKTGNEHLEDLKSFIAQVEATAIAAMYEKGLRDGREPYIIRDVAIDLRDQVNERDNQ